MIGRATGPVPLLVAGMFGSFCIGLEYHWHYSTVVIVGLVPFLVLFAVIGIVDSRDKARYRALGYVAYSSNGVQLCGPDREGPFHICFNGKVSKETFEKSFPVIQAIWVLGHILGNPLARGSGGLRYDPQRQLFFWRDSLVAHHIKPSEASGVWKILRTLGY